MMKDSGHGLGKVFLVFAVLCIVALPFIVISAFSSEPRQEESSKIESGSLDFDHKGQAVFKDYDRISNAYVAGLSTERTLEEYYSRRQYPGSPPYISHKVEDEWAGSAACLTCHAKGGWSAEFKRHTPLTPHPEQESCRQCHIPMGSSSLFVESGWLSLPPPLLGRAALPGAPPPIPHDLQTRGQCVACHVGPGAVNVVRVEHPSRGNCRQCHVPDFYGSPFERKPKY